MKRLSALLALLAVLVVTSAACSSKKSPEHNDADVTFVEESIPHQEKVIEISALAAEEANTPEVKKLAEEISAKQEEEKKMMEEWLELWGVHEHPAPGHADEERRELEEAKGVEFDRTYLHQMIELQKEAMEVTKTVLKEGKSKEAKKLAGEMVRAQEKEIEDMEELLVTI